MKRYTAVGYVTINLDVAAEIYADSTSDALDKLMSKYSDVEAFCSENDSSPLLKQLLEEAQKKNCGFYDNGQIKWSYAAKIGSQSPIK